MKICIVGNAESLLTGRLGPRIDAQDVVVRINGGAPRTGYESAMGTKTNIWSISCLLVPRYLAWRRAFAVPPALMLCLNRKIEYEYVTDPYISNPDLCYRHLIENYGYEHPSTGLITAHFLRYQWRAEVTLAGFDFFETGTHYRQLDKMGPHDGPRERDYLLSELGCTLLGYE